MSRSAGRGGSSGAKFRISLGLPVGAVINCADNTGENDRPPLGLEPGESGGKESTEGNLLLNKFIKQKPQFSF